MVELSEDGAALKPDAFVVHQPISLSMTTPYKMTEGDVAEISVAVTADENTVPLEVRLESIDTDESQPGLLHYDTLPPSVQLLPGQSTTFDATVTAQSGTGFGPNAAVRAKAEAVFKQSLDADRAKVVVAFAPALELKGDPKAGKAVFQKHCAACHRLDGVGHEVGPDLLAVIGNKSGEDLLVSVFDPNREVDPRYLTYQVGTADERVLTGVVVAETTAGHRVLETSQPPAFYFPPGDVDPDVLRPSAAGSWCEWKGQASYWTLVVGDRVSPDAAWSYAHPAPGFTAIADHLAFYPQRVDRCTVDGEVVAANDGDFYGGWITSHVVGPFKGGPGSRGW